DFQIILKFNPNSGKLPSLATTFSIFPIIPPSPNIYYLSTKKLKQQFKRNGEINFPYDTQEPIFRFFI
ncbi:hypothetical protein GIB67_042824, partial [Kingdonia uniflora]